MRSYVLLISLVFIFISCSERTQLSSRTITLSISKAGNEAYAVAKYQVSSNPFVKGQQQGRYQAHIYGADEEIIHRINFEKMDLPADDINHKDIVLMVSLPLDAEAKYIEIYQLDGRSGHYQLTSEEPLLYWSIPPDVK